jgi:hypothetical protein
MIGSAHAGIPRHVIQRTHNDCAIATVATAANVPYEDIAARSPVTIGVRGLFPLEVHHLIMEATGVPWQGPRYGWLLPIAVFADAPDPVVAIIRRPWKWHIRHWVTV